MDNIHNWGYYNPLKGNLGLQLSTAVERDTKPFISNGAGFLHRDCGLSESSVSVGYMRDGWINYNRDNKFVQMLPMNYHANYGILPPEPPEAHALQMMHSPNLPIDEKPPVIKDEAKKKRSQGRANKPPKPKKPKKVAAPKDETKSSASRGKTEKLKNTGLVINGVDLDISGFPTPVCSCTGNPQACYRWGIGGWQSACCTTNMSAHPLPMSTKRRGARIAGRKMSQGAFKKVLEKLAGEGCNLSNPIDLKAHWAKHGTNKFVTIR